MHLPQRGMSAFGTKLLSEGSYYLSGKLNAIIHSD
jgi:hypothetical protein